MRLTDSMVKWFEREQRDYGTKTAMSNLLWMVAESIFAGIGVRSIKTTYRSDAKKRRVA